MLSRLVWAAKNRHSNCNGKRWLTRALRRELGSVLTSLKVRRRSRDGTAQWCIFKCTAHAHTHVTVTVTTWLWGDQQTTRLVIVEGRTLAWRHAQVFEEHRRWLQSLEDWLTSSDVGGTSAVAPLHFYYARRASNNKRLDMAPIRWDGQPRVLEYTVQHINVFLINNSALCMILCSLFLNIYIYIFKK